MRTISIAVIMIVLVSISIATGMAVRAESSHQMEIVSDEEAGVFRFIIDNREVAALDKEGLRINGNLSYSGWIQDAPAPAAADSAGGAQ